jgi:hypothetical protein
MGVVPFYSQPHERYLRAEALRAVGRDQEAAGWYSSFGEHSPYGRVYRAPAELRLAEIDERRGRGVQAAARYARFLELWRDCDPELRPLVRQAELRLARLRPTPGD